ncbi:hypothetical protein MoryE10_19950 [Methylogaea oryzae]|uniref:Uncharacterized protein n=2 Tax=Methylogaea oryzae TaxID=1295382 RepID=A0A8D4VRU4_9GAMM|nr:hypothetical protein MoryE10_19950 [Methylogaea oryzae]
MAFSVGGIGHILNAAQSTFVGLLRVLSIPIVLSLGLASGYTTYYGMAHFITDWIALIVTVAVQSITVICSLELAGMHFRANAVRYLATCAALLVALCVSVSFSYFQFYEISQKDDLVIDRHKAMRVAVNEYLDAITKRKAEIMAQQQARVEEAYKNSTSAFLGTQSGMPEGYKNNVGKGPVWEHYNQLYLQSQADAKKLAQRFGELDELISVLRAKMSSFTVGPGSEASVHAAMLDAFQKVQGGFEALAAEYVAAGIPAPVLPSFTELNRPLEPSFAMWHNVSLFALACALMVDFFTVVLSYKLEFSAPGPLNEEEKELAYTGLRQFSEFTINRDDELEILIEKTELERARRFSDWNRMFVVAMLLNRGYLRKVNDRRVEFAPNLYPVMAERMRMQPPDESPAEGELRLRQLVAKKVYG